MAKPIAVIYFPENFQSAGNSNWIYEYMRYLNGELPIDGEINFGDNGKYWTDYYWFCFPKRDILEPQLEVFHEKDFTEIQYEELKALIADSINSVKK